MSLKTRFLSIEDAILYMWLLVGVRVSSLSKGDNERNTLDFYAHSSSEQQLESFPSSSSATSSSTTISCDNHTDKEDGGDLLTCPICNKPVCDDNDLLNSHIDMCLNQQVLGLEKTLSSSTTRKHKR